MKVKSMIRALFGAYFFTILLLLLLAFLLFRFDLSEKLVGTGISAVYILSCFLGGFLAGKRLKQKKFFWGAALGMIYFILLIAISCVIEHSLPESPVRTVAVFFTCLVSGTLGGMLS